MKMDKPIAIDLFCGLFKPKFFGRANTSVKKFMASGTQNPNHVCLRVRSESPRTVALMRWTMGYLKNTRFATGLAGAWHFWPSSGKPVKCHVLEFPIRFIKWSPFFIFTPRPLSAKFPRCRIGAIYGAIALVRAWWDNFKVLSASLAVCSVFSGSFVFLSSYSSSTRSAIIAAPFFIRPDRLKWISAEFAS
jgi:hypothetical protein